MIRCKHVRSPSGVCQDCLQFIVEALSDYRQYEDDYASEALRRLCQIPEIGEGSDDT